MSVTTDNSDFQEDVVKPGEIMKKEVWTKSEEVVNDIMVGVGVLVLV